MDCEIPDCMIQVRHHHAPLRPSGVPDTAVSSEPENVIGYVVVTPTPEAPWPVRLTDTRPWPSEAAARRFAECRDDRRVAKLVLLPEEA